MKRLITVFFLFLFSFCSLNAQVSTEGKDFWLAFMENADNATPSSLEIFITSNEVASGTIHILQTGQMVEFTVNPGVTFQHVVSNEMFNSFAPTGSGLNPTKKGIHVTSDVDVSVFAFNRRLRSADATVVLPTPTLGKEYFIASYFEQSPVPGLNTNNESEFVVLGTESETNIEITPSVATVDGRPAGVPFTITLNQGEVFQLQSREDLTGTFITSVSNIPNQCNNFAVFSGNKWTGVGGCGNANDQLYEQLFPVNTWGQNFTVVPYKGRNSNGDLFRVISSEGDTEVSITTDSGVTTTTTLVAAGNYLTENVNEAVSISANRPVQVVQYSKSQCAELQGALTGDPFMLVVSPNEQLLKKVTFNTLRADVIDSYFTTVIAKTSSRTNTKLNGASINDSEWTALNSNPDLSYARLDLVGDRDYTLEAEDGFISYVYGFGNIESFGYAAGASLENLNLQVLGDDPQIGIIAEQACLGSDIQFEASFEVPPGEDPRFDTFDWDFGDGETGSGETFNHVYAEPGLYTVVLVASNGTGACSTSETISREIEILDSKVDEIQGPPSVCPDVTGISYEAFGGNDITAYEWTIDGGTIVSGVNDQVVVVDWGAARPDAKLIVVTTNSLGCKSEPVQLDVLINKRLEPVPPRGTFEICYAERASVNYFTPITNGSEYEWFLTGDGSFDGGINTGNSVNITWNGAGTGTVWYREYNPSISDCEGFSDVQNVIIHTEIVPTETISDVLCFEGNTGSIALSILGGVPGYTVNWSNGATGLIVENLTAGDYTATITDDFGCEVEFTYTVAEPDLLEVSPSTITDVRCFGESNGSLVVQVTGGVEPYSYFWTGPDDFSITTTAPNIDGLIAGTYNVLVTDANACTATTELIVVEPELLEPDLEKLINEPICPQASNGEVKIDGKGGTQPYQFFWNTTPQQDGDLATGLMQGEYTVTIIDANGCTASLDVEVKERFPRVFIPSAFSPNNDGENDKFVAITDCTLSFNMQVFNKWGSVVFATTDITEGWDGTYEGKNVPDGIYSYKVFYSGNINTIPFEETINGTVRIFR